MKKEERNIHITPFDTLKMLYNGVVEDYCVAFCKKHDFEYENDAWVGGAVGTIISIADYFIDFQDIKYDIDNDIDKSVFFQWHDYAYDMAFLGAKQINYPSWVKGAPRRTQEWIEEAYKRKEKISEMEQQLKEFVESDF